MTIVVLDYRRITCRCTPIFVCRDCGAQGRGDSVDIEITEPGCNPLLPSTKDVSNNRMPVGWSSYTDGVRCQSCADRRARAFAAGEVQADLPRSPAAESFDATLALLQASGMSEGDAMDRALSMHPTLEAHLAMKAAGL